MPPDNLHMTTLEVAHSLTADEVSELVILAVPLPPTHDLTNPGLNPRSQPPKHNIPHAHPPRPSPVPHDKLRRLRPRHQPPSCRRLG